MNAVVVAAEAFLAALRTANDESVAGDVHHAREAVFILLDAMDATGVLDEDAVLEDEPVQVAA